MIKVCKRCDVAHAKETLKLYGENDPFDTMVIEPMHSELELNY
jgi:hypothetical protein